MDNNISASRDFFTIIDEIKDCGFQAGSTFGRHNRMRYVDFNQGVDARRTDREKIRKIAEIAIRPLRLAFDHLNMSELYRERMIEAIDAGIRELSTYMLYNFVDKPRDLYRRMRINIELNETYQSMISSFPMKYIPLNARDRHFVGQHWTMRRLRSIQLILNVTKGIVSHRTDFFEHAFGRDEDEFNRIILMPFPYIFDRKLHEKDGTIDDWNTAYSRLSRSQREEFKTLVAQPRLSVVPVTSCRKLNALLEHYECEKTTSEKKAGSMSQPVLLNAVG